ncbi:hypothetical protein BKA93DRAFT_818002 [Sparassis latifolia]
MASLSHSATLTFTESYGAGLLVFHITCDAKHIPEEQRAPASSILMSSFVAMLAGTYSGKTIASYFYSVHIWHILHGLLWLMNKAETNILLKSADVLTPSTSKHTSRQPLMTQQLLHLHGQFKLSDSFDAAVWACLTTVFYAVARIDEVTIPKLTAFDGAHYVKRSNIRLARDRNGLEEMIFFIPVIKAASHGEDIYWAKQNRLTDPAAALANHLSVNNLPPEVPLFAYLHRCIGEAGKDIQQHLYGHSICIGGTLEYLLWGIPFESEAFTLYLQKHAQVMAPYMQATPDVHASLVLYSMPPVH